jgi:hypothetical protein
MLNNVLPDERRLKEVQVHSFRRLLPEHKRKLPNLNRPEEENH